MLAIYTVTSVSIVAIILSFILYCHGYKRDGIMMFRGVIAFNFMYYFMVLLIGLAPMPR